MNERYYKRLWDDEFYIFDSESYSEDRFDEEIDYDDYKAFSNSLTGDEILDLLNENEELKKEFLKLKHRHSSLHDECLDAECERDSLKNNEFRVMAENKRFTVPDRYRFSHSKIQLNGELLTNDELVRVLNVNDGAFVKNFNLKTENKKLKEENKELKELLDLIADADSYEKEYSVKEILRNKIKMIDTVTEHSAKDWDEYCILSDFFKKKYGW